jgi:serine/threonine-protein phosphatase 6 regulatory ankyrin repeat subunit B
MISVQENYLKNASSDVAKILIEYNSKNGQNYVNANELFYHIEKRNVDVVKTIFNCYKTAVFDMKPSNYSIFEYCYTSKISLINQSIINDMNEILELFIQKGSDLNKNYYRGFNPVIYASWLGKKAALKIMIDHGANVNCKTQDGTSALMFASMAGHDEIINILIDHGADVNYKNDYGFGALAEAMTCNRTSSIELLKKRGANFSDARMAISKIKNAGTNINTKDIYGVSMLMRSAYERNFIKSHYLLDHGANVNEKSKNTPPLILSVRASDAFRNYQPWNCFETYKLLVDHGADPYFGNDEKLFNNLLANTFATNSNIFMDLIKNKPPALKIIYSSDLFNYIVNSQNLQLIDFALKNFPDLNYKVPYSDYEKEQRFIPLLHFAIKNNRVDIAKLLFSNGADKNSKSEFKDPKPQDLKQLIYMSPGPNFIDNEKYNGCNAFAIVDRKFETFKFLCDNGLDVNDINNDGYTPLMFASMSEEPEVLKLLIEHNADINSTSSDKYSMTPLLIAISGNNDDAVDFLVARGARIDCRTIEGWTPLMLAVQKGNCHATKLLINKGVDVNATNDNGETALDIAYNYRIQENLMHEILSLLKNSGAINLKRTFN